MNPEDNLVAVATVVGPGPTATHLPTRFEPDGTWQQSHLEDIYSATGGQVTFLGDWHSHPSGGFGMSRQDRQTMRQTARTPHARIRHPLMGLLARTPDGDYRLGVWRWRRSRIPFSYGRADAVEVRPWAPTSGERLWDNPS